MSQRRSPGAHKRLEIRVDSSIVDRLAYDARRHVLTVYFRTGGVYEYDDVAAIEVAGLLTAPSSGEYFNHRIRSLHPVRRVA